MLSKPSQTVPLTSSGLNVNPVVMPYGLSTFRLSPTSVDPASSPQTAMALLLPASPLIALSLSLIVISPV